MNWLTLTKDYFPHRVLVGCVVIAGGCVLQRIIRRLLERRRLYAALAAYHLERQREFTQIRDKLSALNHERKTKLDSIAQMTYQELKSALQSEAVSAVEALQAYQGAALQAHENTNCLCRFVSSAESRAQHLDSTYGGKETAKPPLFGIPFSVKESVEVVGCLTTRGYVRRLIEGKSAESNAVIVEALLKLGAVPFVTTNVPQTLLTYGCSNPIYGTTTNPHSAERTCGGSSGGEAALIASGGSLFGIGGDVGGSIRIPSAFSGICGLKPTSLRMSQIGSASSMPGRPLLESSVGIMAQTVEILVDVNRLLYNADMHQRDFYVTPLGFNDELFETETPLTIGYYTQDGWFETFPCYVRAVNEATKALAALGHTLVPWKPPRIIEVIETGVTAAVMDSGRYLLDHIRDDIPEPLHKPHYFSLWIPIWLRRSLAYILPRRLAAYARFVAKDTAELRATYERIQKYRKELCGSWISAGLDAVICPAFPIPAPPSSVPSKLFATLSYTAIYNLVNYPAGVVRWTKVSAADENAAADYPREDPHDTFAAIARTASVSGTVGLPVGIQVASPMYRDEVCMRLMRELEDLRESNSSQ